MSAPYIDSLQTRVSLLTAEYARIENESTVAQGPTDRLQRMANAFATRQACKQIERKLHQARRLLARTQGDEYIFRDA